MKVERNADQQFIPAEREDHLVLVKNCCCLESSNSSLRILVWGFFFRTTHTTFFVKLGNVHHSFDDIDRIVTPKGRYKVIAFLQ